MLQLWVSAMKNHEELMRVILLVLGVVTSSVSLLAQCATGTVEVHGVVRGLGRASEASVTVALESPKGRFSKDAIVSNGEFLVEVQFSTGSSPYFPVWGHRCNNLPKSVVIQVTTGNHVVAEKRLRFKDSFETRDGLRYRLKNDLTLSTPADAGNTERTRN